MHELAEIRALLFGASVGAAVGPIALLIVHVGASFGLRRGAECAVGVAAADFTYALLALALGAQIEIALTLHGAAFEVGSACVLVVLGVWLAWTAWHNDRRAPDRLPAEATRPGFASAYLLTLANPLTLLLFAAFSGQVQLSGHWADTPRIAAFIFLGSLPAQLIYAGIGAGLRTLLAPALVLRANLVSATAIAAFGLYGIFRAL